MLEEEDIAQTTRWNISRRPTYFPYSYETRHNFQQDRKRQVRVKWTYMFFAQNPVNYSSHVPRRISKAFMFDAGPCTHVGESGML